jgi:ABC-type polar amino acid transport system ATPase subunit
MLKAENISFSYGSKNIIQDVDINVARGGITALLGPSGTGKTTLLKCLALLEAPQKGRIVIDDIAYDFPQNPADRWSPPWPALTVVFQQLFLWPHLTLRDNILLPLRKHDIRDVERRLMELSDMFGMTEFLNRYPNETSRGQQQRAALARALMLKPRYILCDEITSALDVEQVGKVLDCLKLVKEQGVGVMIITHQLGFAKKSADEIVFMDDGRVVEHGTAEILSAPKTERFREFLKLVEAAH